MAKCPWVISWPVTIPYKSTGYNCSLATVPWQHNSSLIKHLSRDKQDEPITAHHPVTWRSGNQREGKVLPRDRSDLVGHCARSQVIWPCALMMSFVWACPLFISGNSLRNSAARCPACVCLWLSHSSCLIVAKCSHLLSPGPFFRITRVVRLTMELLSV